MISTKCDNCKNKAWCWSCDDCQSKPFQCFVCNEIITYRKRHDHLINVIIVKIRLGVGVATIVRVNHSNVLYVM